MISFESSNFDYKTGSARMSLKGLSSDIKPTGEYQGVKILNGSSFLEMDTKDLKFYDEESEIWV